MLACLLGALAASVATADLGRQRTLLRRAAETLSAPTLPFTLTATGTISAASDFDSIVSVSDFGANGTDPAFDNTIAFTAAIAAVSGSGGVVFAGAGSYTFLGSLTLPLGVSLVGTFVAPAGGTGAPPPDGGPPAGGTILCPRAGRGNETAQPFVTVSQNAALRGVIVYYPDVPYNATPVPYPWTVDLVGANAAVLDSLLLNPYNAVRAVAAPRHYVARVQGQPSNIGVFVDQTFDIGRLEDVHWMHVFSTHRAYLDFLGVFGTGFIIARSDWEYVLNTFVFEMAIGYRFLRSASGACNGNFLGIGADACQNASVLVEDADPFGILITNGEFTSFAHPGFPAVGAQTQVVVTGSNAGSVRFVTSAFWGPGAQIAAVNGTGSVGFDSCLFNAWAGTNASAGAPAITLSGGDLLVRGCDFQVARPGGQVLLGPAAGRAIVTSNLVAGALNVTDLGAVAAVVQNNAPTVAVAAGA